MSRPQVFVVSDGDSLWDPRHMDTAGQSGRLSVADVCHVLRRLWLITLSSLYTPVRLQVTVSARTEGGPRVSA